MVCPIDHSMSASRPPRGAAAPRADRETTLKSEELAVCGALDQSTPAVITALAAFLNARPELALLAASDCTTAIKHAFRRQGLAEKLEMEQQSDGVWTSRVVQSKPRALPYELALHAMASALLGLDEGQREYVDLQHWPAASTSSAAVLQDAALRWRVLWSLLCVLTSGGRYDARGRTFLRFLAELWQLDWRKVLAAEQIRMGRLLGLHQAGLHQQRAAAAPAAAVAIGKAASAESAADGDGDAKGDAPEQTPAAAPAAAVAQSPQRSISSQLAVGAGAVVGGAALYLTGGIAATATAAPLAYLGVELEVLAACGVGDLLFGSLGAGLGAYKMGRRTQSVQQLEFVRLDEKRRRGVDLAQVVDSLREVEVAAELAPAAAGPGADAVAAAEDVPTSPSAAAARREPEAPRPPTGLSVVVAVAGWENQGAGTAEQFGFMAQSPALAACDCFALAWESETLQELGHAFGTYVRDTVVQSGAKELALAWELAEVALVDALALVHEDIMIPAVHINNSLSK